MIEKKKKKRKSKSLAQKKNKKNRTIKTVARTSPVKNVRMVMTAGAVVNTVLADVALLHLL